jgi:N-acetylglucosamine-6-phosphate deacetylase
MASKVPAHVMGLNSVGTLQPAQQADFVLLNEDLRAKGTWIKGEQQIVL